MPMQDLLPAGWLAFAGRELNPLGRDERFPSCYISSPFPGFILTLPCKNAMEGFLDGSGSAFARLQDRFEHFLRSECKLLGLVQAIPTDAAGPQQGRRGRLRRRLLPSAA